MDKLWVDEQYMRTEPSETDNRSHDPIDGKWNNFEARRNDQTPGYILQNHTVVDLEGTVKIYLKDGSVSTHYVIDKDGSITKIVPEEFRIWNAGVGSFKAGSCFNPEGTQWTDQVASGDMNSCWIGIDNVNTGYQPFTRKQLMTNIILMEDIISRNNQIDPKRVVGHSDWAPGRKIGPNPYFDWKLLANASKYIDGVDHDFGVYPDQTFKLNEETLIEPGKSPADDSVMGELRGLLLELGYKIDNNEDDQDYDKSMQKAVFAFNMHYRNKAVVKEVEVGSGDITDFEKHPFLKRVSRQTLDAMGEVKDLFNQK